LVFGLKIPILENELKIAGDRVQGGSDLVGHGCGDLSYRGKFLRLAQLPLGFKQGFVEKSQLFVPFGQFRGGGLDSPGQLLVELADLSQELNILFMGLSDRPEHAIKISPQLSQFIFTLNVRFRLQVAFFRTRHSLHQLLNGISDQPPKEDRERDQDDENAQESQDDRPVSLLAQKSLGFIQRTDQSNSTDHFRPLMEGNRHLQPFLLPHIVKRGKVLVRLQSIDLIFGQSQGCPAGVPGMRDDEVPILRGEKKDVNFQQKGAAEQPLLDFISETRKVLSNRLIRDRGIDLLCNQDISIEGEVDLVLFCKVVV
jgi:hypothetical protein